MLKEMKYLRKIRRIKMEHLPKELKDSYLYDIKYCEDLDLDRDLINVSDILKAYYILADYFTDPSSGDDVERMLVGVRSYDLLCSATGRQSVEFCGKRKYTDKIDICSTLFYGLTKNHSFHDAHVIIRTKLEKPSKINGLHYFSPYFLCSEGRVVSQHF